MKKILIPVVILTFLLTGCWDIVESEKLGLTTILGVDTAEDGQIRVLINELSEQKSSGGQQQGSQPKKPSKVHEAIAPTIYEAIEKINASNFHRAYFAHTSAIVFSEELVSSRGIDGFIDYFERTPEIRRNMWLLITKKGQFDKVIGNINISEAGNDIGKIIQGIIENKSRNSFITTVTLGDFLNSYWETGSDPYTSGLSIKNVNGGKNSVEEANSSLLLESTAVFKKDRFIGWMNNEEGKGILWVRGDMKGGIIHVSMDKKDISLRIIKENTDIKPEIVDGKIKMNVSLKVMSIMGESQINLDFEDKEVGKKIEELQADEIKKEIIKTFDKSKQLDSDIFGFGNLLYGKFPKYWEQLEKDGSNYYDNLTLDITIDSRVNHAGLIRRQQR